MNERNNIMNNQIKQKLRKTKWKGEQINYVTKKIEGKRIGMWEIPIFRKKEQKKIQEEMKKRRTVV